MKFVFAPDSFKGTLSSEQQIGILKQKAQEIFPEAETVGVPIADGGEGTMRAIWNTAGGKLKKCRVTGPLGAAVEAEYLILDEDRVFIEMAQASGITLIPYKSGNAGKTTSYGTGSLSAMLWKRDTGKSRFPLAEVRQMTVEQVCWLLWE